MRVACSTLLMLLLAMCGSPPAPPAVWQLGVTVGAVASADAHATDVGMQVLADGGNAIDAAVAVGLALAVTHPSAGNLGGGGFLIVRFRDGDAVALDYRERAPAAATRDMYVKQPKDSLLGARAAGIPGTVAGFAHAHRRWGKLTWKRLVEPAIRLAKHGHVLDAFHADDLRRGVAAMRKAGFDAAAKVFTRTDGSLFEAGDTFRQPELATTLEVVARNPRHFYEGPFARNLVDAVRSIGGIWSQQDLATYTSVEREPIRFVYRGHEVLSMPPPSGGGIVLAQVLQASEARKLHEEAWRSPKREHLWTEMLRRAYRERSLRVGDPDQVEVPVARMIDPAYVRTLMDDIDPLRATPSGSLPEMPDESEETTHYSVLDKDGMAVSNTYTLNGSFGAKVVAPGTGVLLNNEMDDFTSRPGQPNLYGLLQGEQNAIAPGKRMLSSMTPTIVCKAGRVRAVLGSPGGPTITTTVAQILVQLLDYGRTLRQAVDAPRLHHQCLPDTICHEKGVDDALMRALVGHGHSVLARRSIGHANCIAVDSASGRVEAVADTKRDGGAASVK